MDLFLPGLSIHRESLWKCSRAGMVIPCYTPAEVEDAGRGQGRLNVFIYCGKLIFTLKKHFMKMLLKDD